MAPMPKRKTIISTPADESEDNSATTKKAPSKKAPAKKAPVKKTVKKTVPKKAPAKKDEPKVSAAKKAAVENVIPKVKQLKCSALNDDQLSSWEWVHAMLTVNPAFVQPGTENERVEIRNVDDRASVLFNAATAGGVPCRHCYTQEAEVKRIIAAMKRNIPKECMSKKWLRRCYPG